VSIVRCTVKQTEIIQCCILFRVPFRNLVVGLMSHQLLIQVVGNLLLYGTTNVVPAEQGVFIDGSSPFQKHTSSASADRSDLNRTSVLPGMCLTNLTACTVVLGKLQ
jgi:hypothetical protein